MSKNVNNGVNANNWVSNCNCKCSTVHIVNIFYGKKRMKYNINNTLLVAIYNE